MLQNTLVVAVGGTNITLTRIRDDNYSSEYRFRETAGEYRLFIRNSKYADKKRAGRNVERHNIEFTHEIYAVAPATVSTIRKAYLVLEADQGDTITDPPLIAAGLCAFLTWSSNSILNAVMSNEA
jgi:hypothetical protein